MRNGGCGCGRDLPRCGRPDMIEAQRRRATIKLKPETAVKEWVWQLSQLFRDKTPTVQ